MFFSATDWTDTYIYALNIDPYINNLGKTVPGGRLFWKSELISGDTWSTLTLADSKVIFGTSISINALDTTDGSMIWQEPTSDFYGLISVVNDTIFTMHDSGDLTIFESKTEVTEDSKTYSAASVTTVDALAETDTFIEVSMNSDAVGTISVSQHLDVNELSEDTGGAYTTTNEFGLVELKKFIEVNADQAIKDNLNEALIKIYYTDDEIAATGILDES